MALKGRINPDGSMISFERQAGLVNAEFYLPQSDVDFRRSNPMASRLSIHSAAKPRRPNWIRH